jgi:hypothetical protein
MFSFKSLIKAWDKFFFEERPTEGIAVFRIIWMGLIFLYYLFDLNNIEDFYGPGALISLQTVREQFPYFHANIFHLFNGSYEFTYTLIIIYGITLLFSIVGFYTRASLVVALICMTSLHQRNIWLLSSSEVLMRTITILLIFSPCGHSLSIDAILGKYYPTFNKKREWPVWVLRLIQIQICVVYVWTVWHKIKGDTWFDGTAVYYATRLESMTNWPLPFVMNSIPLLKLATWGTLFVELALGILVWFKEFRKPVIIAGIIFHVGIEYLMSIPFFELYMIALIINFYTPEELKAFATKVKASFVEAIQASNLGEEIKGKIVDALGGQHETAN